MKYPMKLSPAVKPFMLVIGATSESSYVELGETALQIHMGGYHVEVPYEKITAAATREWPIMYGLGVRVAPKAVGYVGSTEGVVQLELSDEQRFPILPMIKKRSEAVCFALEDPDSFLTELWSHANVG